MKERLTGAIILVALIVLLVPELLTGPVASGSSQPTATSAEEPPLRSYTINLADDAHGRGLAPSGGSATPEPSGPAQPAQASPSGPATITEAPAAADGSAANAPAPAAPERPTPAERPTAAERGSAAHASASPSPAEHSGAAEPPAPKPTPPAVTSSKPPARAAAPAVRANPEPAAAGDGMSRAHGTTGGWMVQLGVFASQSNADRLAQELKAKGFKISVAEVPGNGRKLFRVRAGPVADRSAASDLQAKLRAAGASGSVVPRT